MALPPTARASLLSFLTVHFAHSPEEFVKRYRGGWIVWEPQTWSAPQNRETAERTTLDASRPRAPPAGDALCFELVIAPGQQIVAGRHSSCELLIEEATFSRRQLVIGCTAPGIYAVSLPPHARPASLRGLPITAEPRTLTSGDELLARDVTLRFYQASDFQLRLADTRVRAGR